MESNSANIKATKESEKHFMMFPEEGISTPSEAWITLVLLLLRDETGTYIRVGTICYLMLGVAWLDRFIQERVETKRFPTKNSAE